MSEIQSKARLGKYELLDKLGEGGFGAVYHGRDTKLGREVAVKVLHNHLIKAPEVVERFRKEALLASSLRHPNIVNMIDLDEQDGQYFLVMDYLPGGSLAQRLQQMGQPLSLAETLTLLVPLAGALDYAHQHQIIHRDVKPSNIMFAADGQPVLSDFGLVKSLADDSQTTTGSVLGSVEYMTPEQIQGQPVSPATDLYALGVVAYQLLTGQVPFRGNTPFEIQSKHVTQPVPDPSILNRSLAPKVFPVLMRALAKVPSERYPNGREFVAALQMVLDSHLEQQTQDLLRTAQDHMNNMRFDEAAKNFEQILSIRDDLGVRRQLAECQRRKSIVDQFAGLLEEKSRVNSSLEQMIEQEDWLPQEHTTAVTTQADDKVRDTTLTVTALMNIAGLIATTLFIIALPPIEQAQDAWPLFHYFINPYLLVGWLCINAILCLVLLVRSSSSQVSK